MNAKKENLETSSADILTKSSMEIFELVTGKSAEDITRSILKTSFFIDPAEVQRKIVQYPDFARKSNEHHPNKSKGDSSIWQGNVIKISDNTKARQAFGNYIGRKMGGKDRESAIGWEVAHIWGRVYDPEYFTAGWNMILLPGFLRILAEEQSKIPHLQKAIQYLAHNLYFSSKLITLPNHPPEKPGESEIPDWVKTFQPNLIRFRDR